MSPTRRGGRGSRCGAVLLAAVLAGGAAGCGQGSGAPPAPGAPGTTAGPSASGPTTGPSAPGTTTEPGTSGTTTGPGATTGPSAPKDDPRPGRVLVQVTVTGGFAGVRNRLVVHRDGAWTVRSGDKPPRTGRQTPAEAAELRAALEDPAFALVPARPTGRPIADGFQYEVVHRHRVVVAGDGERPPALQRVFDALPEGGPPTSP
ncbi:hypothetical protein ACFUGD_26630 [Streptomyces sp. NPDC057217]|uniref:hypothetical protein n=1 Tax=unclassified Streptomyces TaxID=2593676 RepID=UPI00362B5CA5